ncbi:hypothetical protein JW906_14250 [bacterium]|nr:hypothetical protein [bacterium]
MSSKSIATLLLVPCLSAAFFPARLVSETVLFQATLKDHLSRPVPEASCLVSGPLGESFSGCSDSLGRLSITLEMNSAAGNRAEGGPAGDRLTGRAYLLRSGTGVIRIFNILGRQVVSFPLSRGEHGIRFEGLASGRYFILMETPSYRAVSSVLLIDGSAAAAGVRVLSNRSGRAAKPCVSGSFTLQVFRQGYESVELPFEPGLCFAGYDEIIRMNLIPSLSENLPDTLWSGFDLLPHIENDDSGMWLAAEPPLGFDGGRIFSSDTAVSFCRNAGIVYADSVNPALTLQINRPVLLKWNARTALLLVVENREWLGFGTAELEAAFETYRELVIPFFSMLFQVPASQMEGLNLVQIIDVYGEAWFIRRVCEAAGAFYREKIVLTDSTATSGRIREALSRLSDSGFVIDMILNVHGDEDGISLSDGFWDISGVTEYLRIHRPSLRSIYTTSCYGAGLIDDWESAGIRAACGATGPNRLAVFSPPCFLTFWTEGFAFNRAVEEASKEEIRMMRSLESTLDFGSFIPGGFRLDQQDIEDSRQQTGGRCPGLHWIRFHETVR